MTRKETRRRLEARLEFETLQLAILEKQVATRPMLDEVQLVNWPSLVASHARSIDCYRARIVDLASDN